MDGFRSIYLITYNNSDLVVANFEYIGVGVWCPRLRRNLTIRNEKIG